MGEGREECGQRGKGPLALAALKVELARPGRSRQGGGGSIFGVDGMAFCSCSGGGGCVHKEDDAGNGWIEGKEGWLRV